MLIMLVGDLHGDYARADHAIQEAHANGITEMIQCGDWGMIWPNKYGPMENQTKRLSNCLMRNKVHMRFIDGNHDVFSELFPLERTDHNLTLNLTYQHRGSSHTYPDGTKVVFMGGAPSIDYEWRTPGISWWPEEQITENDVNRALSHGRADIVIMHDAAEKPEGLKETSNMTFNMRAADSCMRVRRVLDVLRPALRVHGHYHVKYTKMYNATKVVGVASNLNSFKDMFHIYDTSARSDW